MGAPLPKNEQFRLKALQSLKILDSKSDDFLDLATQMAAEKLGVKISLVSLVDKNRQWFLSKYGLEATETPREWAFCAYAILQTDPFLVEDSRQDERFKNNPLVTGDPNVTFYVGVPLTVNSHKIGTLCAIDDKPRKLTEEERHFLITLSRQVETYLEMRKKIRSLDLFSSMLEKLHKLSETLNENFEELAKAYLQVGAEIFTLEFGVISRIQNDQYFVRNTLSPNNEIQQGDMFSLSETYCKKVVESKKTTTWIEIGKDTTMKTHRAYIDMQIETYIGTPIWVNGEIYGTLSYSSKSVRNEEFSQQELNFIELMAASIGRKIELQQRDLQIKRMLSLLDAAPEYIGVADLSTSQTIYANRAMVKFTGKEANKNFEVSQYHPAWAMKILTEQGLPSAMEHGYWKGESAILSKDGIEIPVLQTVVIHRGESGQPAYASTIMQDISELKRYEQELVKSREKALAASKAKTSFLANMSHEIRTPLTAIIGVSDILADYELEPKVMQYIKTLQGSAEYLAQLVNDILDLSKIEADKLSLNPSVFSFQHEVDKIQEIFKTRFEEKNIDFFARIEKDLGGSFYGDEIRISQMIINLIGNAIKFTKDGEIQLNIKPNTENNRPGNVLISVSDTGIGIPANKINEVFADFTQAEESTYRDYGGTGLGLSITRQLAKLMGGDIWVESVEGRGSTFYFTLLLKDAAGKFSHASTTPMPAVNPLTNLNILIVDDNSLNRMILQTYIEGYTNNIDFAENGNKALELMKQNKYDYVFLDMQMPGKDGYQTIQEYRSWEKEQNLPRKLVVSLSAFAIQDEIQKSLDAGCDHYLTKPIRRETLFQFLAKGYHLHQNPIAS